LNLYAEAGHMIGDPQVRNRGTIGGSIAHADPAADWPGILLVSNATIHLAGASGSRSVAGSDFFISLFTTALQEGELITGISVPIPPAGTRSTYQKFVQPASRFALVGCAVMGSVTDGSASNVSVAFNGVSAAPFRDNGVEEAMNGKEANAENIAGASSNAANGKSIMQSHFASEVYRSHLAKVYAKKALSSVLLDG
ncbi:MAG: FAD binding domain-containing protein, partial [Bacteroidota bacterium]